MGLGQQELVACGFFCGFDFLVLEDDAVIGIGFACDDGLGQPDEEAAHSGAFLQPYLAAFVVDDVVSFVEFHKQ